MGNSLLDLDFHLGNQNVWVIWRYWHIKVVPRIYRYVRRSRVLFSCSSALSSQTSSWGSCSRFLAPLLMKLPKSKLFSHNLEFSQFHNLGLIWVCRVTRPNLPDSTSSKLEYWQCKGHTMVTCIWHMCTHCTAPQVTMSTMAHLYTSFMKIAPKVYTKMPKSESH